MATDGSGDTWANNKWEWGGETEEGGGGQVYIRSPVGVKHINVGILENNQITFWILHREFYNYMNFLEKLYVLQ